ncbi:D-arabinono-1,4-lactone oxidase-domain-containing protein [Pyronema omphalodes]|nr:D-arabinono-1,4-lactone oxidase-domain-containing protein [Pyronema omphalodes]
MDPNAYSHFHAYTTPLIAELSWDPVSQKHIPFRASLRHQHSTWARTFYSRPELYLQPESIEELRLIITLARRLSKNIVVVGSGHSPSDMTCHTNWMVNLDNFRKVLSEDHESKVIVVEAGIRLHQFLDELDKRGWAVPNLGSITEQSIAGAIATSTHGSTLQHGILSESVVMLRIMLASGKVVECTKDLNPELFQAALVSLGALGIVVAVGFQAVEAYKIRWRQEVTTLEKFLQNYDTVWHETKFARCWWFPYSERCIVWRGEHTDEPIQEPPKSWYGGSFGRWTYETMLYITTWIPSLTPAVERFVFKMQYGWEEGVKATAVQNSHEALIMDCLFSQLVNEWSLPLDKGPEVIRRLQDWLSHRNELSRIPISSKDIYVHAPIEVRITDSSRSTCPRAWLDQSMSSTPTLYLNATLYRPFLKNVAHWERYYEAFEYLMKEMGGKPHWAKNFVSVTPSELFGMYPEMGKWVKIRNQVDPDGVFVTKWLKRHVLDAEEAAVAIASGEEFKIVEIDE